MCGAEQSEQSCLTRGRPHRCCPETASLFCPRYLAPFVQSAVSRLELVSTTTPIAIRKGDVCFSHFGIHKFLTVPTQNLLMDVNTFCISVRY